MRLLVTLSLLVLTPLGINNAEASHGATDSTVSHKLVKRTSTNKEESRRKRKSAPTKKTKRLLSKEKKHRTTNNKAPLKVTYAGHKVKTNSTRHKRTLVSVLPPAAPLANSKKHRLRTLHGRGNDELQPIHLTAEHRRRYQQARQTAMNKLMGQLGKPYHWGGTSPRTGFDCSGLVYYAYKDVVKFRMPRTANEMYHMHKATVVSRNELRKGDLVFFRLNGRGVADHVGVYLGNGKFIQSPRTGKDIQITALSDDYWQRHYLGARRMMTPMTIR